MNNAIFIPEKMRVGFQNRQGTFTGKLAYIIYYDNKGKLRKEKSWEGWRDKSIEPIDFLNEPIEGFCLNKKVGGYDTGWNHRSTYCRIYDPRGYEFEINIENLLYILENTNSIKGKGLEGKFVYGMNGKDLILIPCESPDYKQLKEFNDKLRAGIKFNMKNMIKGATYLNAKNEELVYIGRYYAHNNCRQNKNEYFFYNRKAEKDWKWIDHKRVVTEYGTFISYASVGKSIIECIDENCCADYADIFDKFEYHESYNPYDPSKDEYINHTLDSFTKYVENKSTSNWNYINFYSSNPIAIDFIDHYGSCNRCSVGYWSDEAIFKWTTYKKVKDPIYSWRTNEDREDHRMDIREFYQTFVPQYKKEYLKDGKLRKELCYDK